MMNPLRRTLMARCTAVLCGLALSSAVFAADTPAAAQPQVALKTSLGDIALT